MGMGTGMGTEIQKIFFEKYGWSGWANELLDWLDSIAFAAVTAVLLFGYVFGLVRVDGPSMYDTLENGNRIIISKMFYRTPKRLDVVVTNVPGQDPLVKRIIAEGGQTVDIDFEQGIVYVDGQALEEPYATEPTYLQEGLQFPIQVPAGSYFLMGDNRNNSKDSRDPEVGMIPRKYLEGKVVFRFWPLTEIGMIE